MKKPIVILGLFGAVVLGSCGQDKEEKQKEEANVKAERAKDSVREKKDVDSLFDVVGKNLDSAGTNR